MNKTTNEIKQRIYNNIEAEAKSHVENGTPVVDRGEEWADVTLQAVITAQRLYKPVVKRGRNKLSPEQRLRRRQEKMAKKNGLNYDEWMKICRSRYSIDPVTFTVTSLASGPSHLKTWAHSTELTAEEHVHELVSWSYYDHHERDGCETTEFRYVPPSNLEKTK